MEIPGQIKAARDRLMRIDYGQSRYDVYGEDGGECGTSVVDTELLADWAITIIDGAAPDRTENFHQLMTALKQSRMEHGDCNSGDRYDGKPLACTACMGNIVLDEAIATYKGRRVKLA